MPRPSPSAPQPPVAKPAWIRQALRSDWSQLLWKTALVGWPAVALCLFAGVYAERPLDAIVAASGAFSVGLGATQRFTRLSLAPMVLACLGMMLSTWTGSMVGGSLAGLLLASALWAAGCGLASRVGPGATWITLQWAIALFVAGGFPGPSEALDRALLVGVGGVTQITILGALIVVFPVLRPPPPSVVVAGVSPATAVATGVRSACSTALALGASRILSLQNGYWAPMTAILVLKPSMHDEFQSIVQRCVGTIVGASTASATVFLLNPTPVALIGMTSCLVAATYALQRVNYFLFSAALTAFIVCLLSTSRSPELALLIHRIIATMLGCIASLIMDTVLTRAGFEANRR